MHKLPIFSLILIPLITAACGDDSTSVTISTTQAPEAIAYAIEHPAEVMKAVVRVDAP